jgi:hypothetical protein
MRYRMGGMSIQEWQIKPPGSACGACGRAFEDGESFVSRLFVEGEAYRREDCCETCGGNGMSDGALSAWRTVFRLPPPKAPEPVRRETAEALLRRSMEGRDPESRDAVFVLAVMLERRRVLIERDVQVQPDGHRLRVYEHRGTGETFLVVDPGLRLDDLERVQTRVMALLGGQTPEGAPAS